VRYPIGVRRALSLLAVLLFVSSSTACLKFVYGPPSERQKKSSTASTSTAGRAPASPTSPSVPGSSSEAAGGSSSGAQKAHASDLPPPIKAQRYRERLREIEIGQTQEAVHARLGNAPVKKPRHPESPLPTPRYVIAFERADGVPIRLESYIVKVRRRDGCPDYTFDDVPITFVGGVVYALDWDSIEWEWEKWGGDLSELRAAQDRFTCEEASEEQEPQSG